MSEPADTTALLVAWAGGDRAALDRLMPLVEREMHRVAAALMSRERHAHLLQPTALLNEAFLRLIDLRRVRWQNRAHFLAMAARLMRRVLIDAARARGAEKRGAALEVELPNDSGIGGAEPARDVVALHDALEALATLDERKSRVVEMRFFGGLSVEEIAEVLGVSKETVMRDWKFARSWLHRELSAGH